jgi:hypothetical protein
MSDEPSKTSASPWSQTGFVLATALVAVLVLIGVVLLVTGGGNDGATGSTGPADTADPSKQDAKATPDPDASVCGLAAGSQKVPAAPPEARWELVGTIAAPTAPTTLGPGISKGDRRLCFAHSPAGALFAAVNFIATTQAASGNVEVVRELTAEGPARDRLLSDAAASGFSSSGGLQVAGFRVSAYDSHETTIDLGLAITDKGDSRLPLSLRWERGDWKVIIATDEGPYAGLESLENLSGFIPWSGT